MTPSVSEETDRELTDATIYYAKEASPALALTFVAEFERVLDLLCAHPYLAVAWRNNRRRFPLRRFPFSIIYYVHDNELRVIALAHHRRKPTYWVRRK
ncbi:MAG: type II toxin-antitoxin system RelE/ParE family toxin [Betaproteobacteria bacterium]|nr:type II toxin-antitoxin system RelE/ParE family toxin [Betaproteobacteria bacterium]